MNFHGNYWMLPGRDADYLISRQPGTDDAKDDWITHDVMRRLLSHWLSASSTCSVLIDIYEQLGGTRPLGLTTLERAGYEQRLKKRLATAIEYGELAVRKVQHSFMIALGPPPRPSPPRSAEAEPRRTEAKSQKTFISIRLEDETGNPLASVAYRIVLPDGSIREGNLDGQGEVRVDDILPGLCEVSFPKPQASSPG